jgi:hypothetical protein
MTLFCKLEPNEILKIKSIGWSRIFLALCRKDRIKDLIEVICVVERFNPELAYPIYTSILSNCISKEWLVLGKRVHKYLEKKEI